MPKWKVGFIIIVGLYEMGGNENGNWVFNERFEDGNKQDDDDDYLGILVLIWKHKAKLSW